MNDNTKKNTVKYNDTIQNGYQEMMAYKLAYPTASLTKKETSHEEYDDPWDPASDSHYVKKFNTVFDGEPIKTDSHMPDGDEIHQHIVNLMANKHGDETVDLNEVVNRTPETRKLVHSINNQARLKAVSKIMNKLDTQLENNGVEVTGFSDKEKQYNYGTSSRRREGENNYDKSLINPNVDKNTRMTDKELAKLQSAVSDLHGHNNYKEYGIESCVNELTEVTEQNHLPIGKFEPNSITYQRELKNFDDSPFQEPLSQEAKDLVVKGASMINAGANLEPTQTKQDKKRSESDLLIDSVANSLAGGLNDLNEVDTENKGMQQ